MLAVAGLRFVVAAHATGRKRFLTYPHCCLTSGSVDVVLSMGVRTFKQGFWRVCVLCCGVALQATIAKGNQFVRLPSRAEVWRKDSLRNVFEMKSVTRSSCPTVTLAGPM